MSAALEPPYAAALVAVQEAPAKNVDETGWKKKALLLWLWVAATAHLAVFRIHPERTRRGLHAFLGDVIKGRLTKGPLVCLHPVGQGRWADLLLRICNATSRRSWTVVVPGPSWARPVWPKR
jgi:hypothetical protein